MIVCFDLETTGLDKYNDEIIEIAMTKFDEKTFEIIETFSTFVNPKREIPSLISNITNIFDSDVEYAPFLDELKDKILSFIWDCPLLWHNVYFDRDFFIEKGIDVRSNIVLDTFFLANFLSFNEASLNLEMLCKSFKIEFSWAHRAANDVSATISLFEALVKKFEWLTKKKKELVYYIFNTSSDKNIVYLKEYIFHNFTSDIDFIKFKKNILKVVWKYIEVDDFIMDTKLDNDLSIMFHGLPKIEIRENQAKMLDVVFNSLNKSKKSVIEAPTGLWKSFAYLIPSITHSVKSGEKVFISTKTKALQDQLYFKDLEYLKKNLPFEFNYTKLKGRKNYLSIKWFFDEIVLRDVTYEKVCFLSKITLWLFDTRYWELDELSYYGKEFSFLRFVSSDIFSFTEKDAEYKPYDFLYKARKKLDTANIIVINHSLLFSDLKGETSVLWNIDNLVIDEAHNVEDSITESLRNRLNMRNLEDVFKYIETMCDKKEIKKIKFINPKEKLLSDLGVIFDYCFSYIHSKVSDKSNYKVALLKEDFFGELEFDVLSKKIESNFLSIIDFLSTTEEFDFSREILSLKAYFDLIKIILDKKGDKEYIRILTFNDHQGVVLEYTLLNPGDYLQTNLWDKIHSVTLTSATLKIWDSFDYLKKILYLDDFDFYSYESDFDYKTQATLFIPNDLWNIKNNSKQIIDFLWKFYTAVRWRTLTLLTSFNMIRQIYTSNNMDLKKEGIHLYAQSIGGSKAKLMRSYLESPEDSILLGTDSFWEWIDMSWDDLKYLIIHKFPFLVPTDQIFQARSVFFEEPFSQYSMPKAIIKLKQWFGRLIRSKKDTGVVVLLDDRIFYTTWWRAFFDAFPAEINIKQGSSEKFIEILEKNI